MSSTPNIGDDDGFPADPIEREAAAWFALRYGGLTGKQEVKFANWLNSDPRHAEAFRELDETWKMLGRTPELARAPFVPPANGERVWLKMVLAVAAAVAFAAVVWWPRGEKGNDYSETVTTEIGVLRRLELPDHSVVQLGPDSVVGVHFTREERRIGLERGQAVFFVAKNPARPFFVRAGSVEVRAVGTAFDVSLRSGSVDLLVTEGKVQVSDVRSGSSLLNASKGLEPLLLAGQRVRIAFSGDRALVKVTPETVSSEQIRNLLAWRDRKLVFHDDSMADIVAEFNHFNRHRLAIGSPELAGRKFGGTYPSADYREFVRSLRRHYGIIGEERSADETVLRFEAPPAVVPASAQTVLVFRADRLADIVAAFNRCNRHQLVVDGAELADQRFGGTFPAGDYEAFVKMLRQSFGVEAVQRGEETILRLDERNR